MVDCPESAVGSRVAEAYLGLLGALGDIKRGGLETVEVRRVGLHELWCAAVVADKDLAALVPVRVGPELASGEGPAASFGDATGGHGGVVDGPTFRCGGSPALYSCSRCGFIHAGLKAIPERVEGVRLDVGKCPAVQVPGVVCLDALVLQDLGCNVSDLKVVADGSGLDAVVRCDIERLPFRRGCCRRGRPWGYGHGQP